MYEYPLLFVGMLVLLSVVLPHLSRTAIKFLLPVAAVPILVALHYMIVTPGWQPGARPLRPPWNRIAFLAIAVAIVAGVILFCVGG